MFSHLYMASRESSVHKCEKPKVSVCPALSSIAALMVFTSGFTRFAPASKSSVPGTSPLAPTAWNWGTKRPAGEESTEVKRYSKVKCQQLSRPRDTADTPSEFVAKLTRKVRADETWWNNPSFRWYIAAIAYVILSPSGPICASHPGCPLLDVNRPLHAFKVIRATLYLRLSPTIITWISFHQLLTVSADLIYFAVVQISYLLKV